jgi:carotenoid cleavage dioxygenase-like enzyme
MDSNFNTRIHLINRKTGEIVEQKFFTQPIFLFHHIHAFETLDENRNLNIITDVCAYDPNHFDINELLYDKYFSDELLGSEKVRSIARRITIPIFETNKSPIYCNIRNLNDIVFELPAINYNRFNGKKYKYFYGVNYFKKPFSIVKINVDNSDLCLEIKFENCMPSEPVFVECPLAQNEDDGILLVICLNETSDFLSIIDAKNLTEICRANIPNDFKASFTFHGFFSKNF